MKILLNLNIFNRINMRGSIIKVIDFIYFNALSNKLILIEQEKFKLFL